jgi:ankyrin repeat protein
MSGQGFGRALTSALLVLGAAGNAVGAGHETSLITAVRHADLPSLRAALAQGVDVDATSADGTTALHWAAHHGDRSAVELLLGAGARVQVKNRFGVTPLSLAVSSGSAATVDRLLKAGADANAVVSGEAPIMTAARTGKVDVIKVLLAHGADVNWREPTRQQTALMWAAAEGYSEAITALIGAGADLHARSDERDFRKRQGKSPGMSQWPSAPTPAFTALMFAIRNGRLDAVRTLLDAGGDVNETLPDGVNTVILATLNAHWELAGVLLDRGANPNAADAGWTALHQVARSRSLTVGHLPGPVPTGRMSSLDLAAKLIAMGADVNARRTNDRIRSQGYRTQLSSIGTTPYLLAAKGGDSALMTLLLASGADPRIRNSQGLTPLMVAAGLALHANGEDTPTPDDTLEAVKVALAADPDVNATSPGGLTALHGAARRGNLPSVKLLLEHGARIDAKVKGADFIGAVFGSKGTDWTPLTIAMGRGKDGTPLFLGEERFLDVAAFLYMTMKERGVPIDEDPSSIALVESILLKTIEP